MPAMGVHLDGEPASRLLGAHDLIRECQEMLRGERQAFTGMDEYLRQRLEYWQGHYNTLDRRPARAEPARRGSRCWIRSGSDR